MNTKLIPVCVSVWFHFVSIFYIINFVINANPNPNLMLSVERTFVIMSSKTRTALELESNRQYTIHKEPSFFNDGKEYFLLYSGSPSGSDVSTQTQLLSACAHSLFCTAQDLALRLANKRTTSLPEDGELEYKECDHLHT